MTSQSEPADFLYGAPAIAAFLGMTEKQARHRIEAKQIPTFKVGGTICARRSSLNAWIAEQEAAALAAKARFPKNV
jgi:hypothetical protein